MTFVTQVLAAARVLTSGYFVGGKVALENARIASDRFLQKRSNYMSVSFVIRHLPGSGKCRPRANTWECVGFPVNGKNGRKSVTNKPHENVSKKMW